VACHSLPFGCSCYRARVFWPVGAGAGCHSTGGSQGAQTNNNAGACDQTTQAAAKACDFNAQNDFWIAVGTCDNLSDAGKKAACNKQAQSDL
jgi:hypothetical protein